MLYKLLLLVKNSLFFFFLTASFLVLNAQDENAPPAEEKGISIDNISEESEKLNQQIYKYRGILAPKGIVHGIDSILTIVSSELNLRKDSLYIELEGISRRNLKERKVEWKNYYSELKKNRERIGDRTTEVIEINDQLVAEVQKWELTKQEFSESSNAEEIIDNINNIIKILHEVLDLTTARLETIYVVEKKITDLILITNAVIAAIKNTESNLKKDYFIFDSQPLWKANDTIAVSEDVEIKNVSFRIQMVENKNQIVGFFGIHLKTAIFQGLFISLIYILLTLVKKKWVISKSELSNRIEINAKTVLEHRISASLTVGVLISVFFYDELIPIVGEFFIIIILCSTLILLPKLTNRRITVFIACLFGVFLLNLLESYSVNTPFIFRNLILLESVILIIGLYIGKKTIVSSPEDFDRIRKIFFIIIPLYTALLIGAIIGNVIGMVGLSRFLLYGILSSCILIVIIYSSIKVITSIVVLLFKLRKSYGMHAVSTMVHAANKRIQPMLFWGGMLVWVIFTIKGFEVLDFLNAKVDEILHLTWKVGETIISLGGIISFTLIFIFTVFVANLIASIFQDKWMVNILPRGLAPGVSLILRIFFVSIGFYIAISSAGLDLSKLGFIVGALGVGIGFGLQNIVLNFIAGLILAFERPINIGDTIEVDNEFGIVSSIGVRSSTIKTYGGYEAIIPNGDLISRKVVNWTLSNRDRRSNILMKTASNANPNEVIEIFNKIATDHPKTFTDPAPTTLFKGYDDDGNLSFELLFWSTFSDTLTNNHEISLAIYDALKKAKIQPPTPVRRIIKE